MRHLQAIPMMSQSYFPFLMKIVNIINLAILHSDTLILTQPELLPNSPSRIAYCLLTWSVFFLLASLERL